MQKMKIAVIGAGISGCTIARLLKDRGHDVVIHEKNDSIGGLCATGTNAGRIYQLYGPHIFHTDTKPVVDFVSRFSRFNGYIHYKGTCVDGRVLPYPISYETISLLEEKEQILKEIAGLPRRPDMANFETYVVSVIGPTLYEKFIKNYTTKFWGTPPKNLEACWAAKRIEIRRDNSLGYFKHEWQGLPVGGYSAMFEKMTQGIDVRCGTEVKDPARLQADLVVSTMPVDELLGFQYGRLGYRGLRFATEFRETQWEDQRYGCINYPNGRTAYIRKTNYDLCYKSAAAGSFIVGYEYPDEESRLYPVYSAPNKALLEKYLSHLVQMKNVISAGRLGLFKYYDMDDAVGWCLDTIDGIEGYRALSPEQRMRLLTHEEP